MAADDDIDQSVRRLEELIAALDAHPDPTAREPARELVALVLDLHGIGLAKLMAILAREPGSASTMARLVEDDQVRAMLLLHGLHPEDMETRVRKAVDRLKPQLGVLGLRLDLVSIERGVVRLRVLSGDGPAPKASLMLTLPEEIEDAIMAAAPDAEDVLIEGLQPQGSFAANAAE